MVVYRVSRTKYIADLSGYGAKTYGGRWNHEGYNVLYTSSNLSLCVLELLANNTWELLAAGYSYISLDIPDHSSFRQVEPSDLPTEWRKSNYDSYTINAGTNWLKEKNSVSLIVPSAVLAQEKNILINPLHEDFSAIKIIDKGPLMLDLRLSL